MLVLFRADDSLAESEVDDDTVRIIPQYYAANSKYTGVGVIEVETSSGVSLGRARLEINVESGELRVVNLVECDEMPADKLSNAANEDITEEETSDVN